MTVETPGASLEGRALRGGAYSLGASAVTLTLGLARAILLARLLLPEHFGVVALGLFYVALAGRLHDLGLDQALIRRAAVDEGFQGTYASLRVALDAAAYGLLALCIPLLRVAYPHLPHLAPVLGLLILSRLLDGLSQLQETPMRRDLAFGSLAALDVTASLLMTCVAVGMAWAGMGVWALVGEQLSGMGARCLMSWGLLRRWRPRLRWDRDALRGLWGYGKPVWVAANTDYMLGQFDDFWVGTALGAAALGFYAKAYELAHYPRRLLANPLLQVLGPTFARVQGNRLALSRLFYRSASLLLRTGYLVAGALALVMPEFIAGMLGAQWLPMLWTFRLMLIYTALDPLLALVAQLLLMAGRPADLGRARVWQLVFFMPAVALGAWLGGIEGVALAADGMLLLGLWRLYRPLRGVVDFSLARLAALPTLALVVAWAAGLALEAALPADAWFGLALKLGVFVALYGLPMLLVERGDYLRGLRWVWALWREHGAVRELSAG